MVKKPAAGVSHWPDLRLRVLSAAVMLPLALVLIMVGGVGFKLAVMLIGAAMMYEGVSLLRQWGAPISLWRETLLCVWPIACGLLAVNGDWQKIFILLSVGLILGVCAYSLTLPVCLAVSGLIFLRGASIFGMEQVLFVVTVVIASDTGAYLSGRCFGGPKLAPRISPNKTRSGAIGGLICAAAMGSAWAGTFTPDYIFNGLISGILLGLGAQTGDLLESFAKRVLGVKDSGSLIPGHGGLLDRLDGLMGAAPIAVLLTIGANGRPFWCASLESFLYHVVH